MGDAGKVNLPICGENAGGGAIKRIVESIGKDLRLIHFAIAVLVYQDPDFVGMLGVIRERFDFGVFAIHSKSPSGGGEGDVVAQPVLVATVVLDAAVEAVGLGEIETILFIKGDCSDVKSVRLTCIDPGRHFPGVLDGGEKRFVRVLGGKFFRVGGAFYFWTLFVIGAREQRGAEKSTEKSFRNHVRFELE